MLLKFFQKKLKCKHENISPDIDAGYCPDCGEYVENKWYLTRCSCCNIKRKTIIYQDTIKPAYIYCPNCGSIEYVVEEIEKINFIDINFAVLVKEVKTPHFEDKNYNQIWVEKDVTKQKLISQTAT